MSLRHIQHVFETYCKDGYLQEDWPRSYFWEIYGQCTKFSRKITISQVLVFTLLHLLVVAYRGVFRAWSNTYNGAFFSKILNSFKLLTILAEKAPSQIFDWVGNSLLVKGLKYWTHSCSQPTSRENTQPKNMSDIVFERRKVVVGK